MDMSSTTPNEGSSQWPGRPGEAGQFQQAGQQQASGTCPQPGQPGSTQKNYPGPGIVRNNRAAVWALICGIGQFVLGLTVIGNIVLAIPAIILGSIALRQIRNRGEPGRNLAMAGLVLGILGVFYFALIILLLIVTSTSVKSAASFGSG
jgi:hypothetical protein